MAEKDSIIKRHHQAVLNIERQIAGLDQLAICFSKTGNETVAMELWRDISVIRENLDLLKDIFKEMFGQWYKDVTSASDNVFKAVLAGIEIGCPEIKPKDAGIGKY